MTMLQTRRRFLTTLSLAGAAGFLGAPRALAAEGALETTTVRFTRSPRSALRRNTSREELLRAEGFTDIRYVDTPAGGVERGDRPRRNRFRGSITRHPCLRDRRPAHPITVLAGVHGRLRSRCSPTTGSASSPI